MPDIAVGSAPPETVLPEPPPEAAQALSEAMTSSSPRASLAELNVGDDVVAAYAFARTGYHRGLDALRAAGWRGSGYVRWRHPSNRGFLRSLEALQLTAGLIGEDDEQQRCALFLRQLDPERRGADR